MEYRLNIALIEPEIPQNTGNIARTCAATGARLHLVGPMGFTITDKQVKRAGLDYWDKLDITYYNRGEAFPFFSVRARTHSIIFFKYFPKILCFRETTHICYFSDIMFTFF